MPQRQKAIAQRSLRRSRFVQTYRNDRAAFVHDLIDWPDGQAPTPYQDELLEESNHRSRIAVKGPHGLGKTVLAAWLILHFALTRDGEEDWKVPTTAGAWRQLEKYLWPEVHKWAPLIRWGRALMEPPAPWPDVGRERWRDKAELLDLGLHLSTGQAFAAACDNPGTIEGAHADSLLYIYDEAKIIPASTFDASEGAFSGAGEGGHEAFALAFSTPGEPAGRFYDIISRKPGYEDWWVRNVTKDELIAAGRMTTEWAEARKRQWGENDPRYLNRVEGLFAASSEDSTIPLAWIEAAQERWRALEASGDWGDMTHLGVDVAEGGDDNTVLARRFGCAVRDLTVYETGDPLQTGSRAQAKLRPWPHATAVVDGIGLGSGTVAELRRERQRVESFIASEGTRLKDKTGEFGFVNKRSAAWWGMRELLEPPSNVALPPDDVLVGDLTAPKWREMAGGRIQVESKDDIRKRLGRSPDRGDAVVMAFFVERRPRLRA